MDTRQKAIFAAIAIAHMCCGFCFALQAPFYPTVASDKGVSPTVFGLVFGIFQLTIFLVSPLCGQYITKIGSKVMLVVGLLVMGMSVISFGLLVFVRDVNTFIGWSFIIRIVEGAASAGYLTSSFSIATQEFSHCLATMISLLEVFYGFGLSLGPSIGGALYDVGGYVTPFATLGSVVIISAIITLVLLPRTDTPGLESKATIWDLLKNPDILMSLFAVVTTTFNIGFLEATLEFHLRQFVMTHLQVGSLFLLSGATYALTTPVWGKLSDMGFHHRWMIVVGACLSMISFSLIGPAPFLPVNASVWLISIALVLEGFSTGALTVASFTGSERDAISMGLPEDLTTFGLVSGCWSSLLAFGAFLGPTCGGALLDAFGFRNACMFVVGMNATLGLCHLFYILFKRSGRPYDMNYINIDSEKDHGSIENVNK